MNARFPLCGILGMVLWGSGCGVEAPEGKGVGSVGGEGTRVEGAVPPPTPSAFETWCTNLKSKLILR